MIERDKLNEKIRSRIAAIYGGPISEVERGIARLLERYAPQPEDAAEPARDKPFSERDVVLITYGDQVHGEAESPLAALHRFLREEGLRDAINTVHLLPFFPYSSDDGFSVIDYLEVDPALGDWGEIERLGSDFRLMFDLVLNHVSQRHAWFQKYLQGEEPYTRYFIDLDPATDLSQVVRPRSHPLLTPFETSRGTKHLWTTFSTDQIDLNYGEPHLLLRMLEVLLEYIRRGAQIIRLDAVAYLWKAVGTSSIHQPQAHEVVKLMRDVAEAVRPGVLLLTETNVPHAENIRYFGAGDEAHMVYQFSLPPLLLDAYLNADGTVFSQWLSGLAPPPVGSAFFNFTASHDGIGVRPLEGLVSEERFSRLVEYVQQRGGLVSMRRMPDGSERPYELNTTYVDAMTPPEADDIALHARRFLASQGIMLALSGMPAVYFHSLVGTRNDRRGVETSGQPRRINRRKFAHAEVKQRLGRTGSLEDSIYRGYRKFLSTRIRQPAFHPAAEQSVVDLGDSQTIAFGRRSLDRQQEILVVANLSDRPKRLDVASHGRGRRRVDLLGHAATDERGSVSLPPYEIAWLEEVSEWGGEQVRR